MKQAWLEHDPNVDTADADSIEELDGIVNNIRAEVARTLEMSQTVLQGHGITIKQRREKKTQKQRDSKSIDDKQPNMEEAQIRRPAEYTGKEKTTPEQSWVASTNITGNNGRATGERWPSRKSRTFESQQTGGQNRNGCGNFQQDESGSGKSQRDDKGAKPQHSENGSGSSQRNENENINYQ